MTGLLTRILTYHIPDTGSIHASTVLYKSMSSPPSVVFLFNVRSTAGLLETVLFANIRFHDTVSRGRLLNRFGKDFEGHAFLVPVATVSAYLDAGIDSNLSDNFGRSAVNGLSVVTTFITLSIVGGPQFFLVILVIGSLYWNGK